MRTGRIVVLALVRAVRSPLPSVLMMASAAFGVCGAVCSLEYALGGREKIVREFDGLGSNMLIVSPRPSRAVAGRARAPQDSTTLTTADVAIIRKNIPEVRFLAATITRPYMIKSGDLSRNGTGVVGVEPSYFFIRRWAPRSGAIFTPQEDRRKMRVAVLGSAIAADLFGVQDPIGSRILIGRVPFRVIGVLTERGQSLDSTNEDMQIYIPVGTAARRLANQDTFSSIVMEISSWDAMDRVASSVERELAQKHPRLGKLPADFQVLSQRQILETRLNVSSQLLRYVSWIQGCALLLSGFGILTISWMSVKERTRELGVRRALGATQADIFTETVSEAFALSAGGCVLGAAAAWPVSAQLAEWAGQPEVFSAAHLQVPAELAIFIGLFFAVLPALNAARMDPIFALRFE